MSHDELDVLGLETTVVDFLIVVIVFFDFLVFDCLALAVLISVVVSRVITASLFSCSELLSSSCLVLRVEILDLSLTEDTIIRQSRYSEWSATLEDETHIQVLLVGDR